MPKKIKVSKKQVKKIDNIKQKQRQSQNVKVEINIPEKVQQKRKRKRTPQKSKKSMGVDFKAFPPQIIYPQEQLTFYRSPHTPSLAKSISEPVLTPPTLAKSVIEPIPSTPSFLEDVGTIGTEGAVEILELPPKSETLQDLISPVPIRTPRVPISLAELAMKTKIPQNIAEDININEPKQEEEEEEEESWGISAEEVLDEPKPSKKKIIIRRTKTQLRKDLENEYLELTGKPIENDISNKELKNLIIRIKKVLKKQGKGKKAIQ